MIIYNILITQDECDHYCSHDDNEKWDGSHETSYRVSGRKK